MNSPKVSVIIPVYNVDHYLEQCVNSILGQSFGDFELILVDDGSKDQSGAICDEYEKKDVRVSVQGPRKQNADLLGLVEFAHHLVVKFLFQPQT